MHRARPLALVLLLAALGLVLSSCSSTTGSTLSFSVTVPTGTTAYATLQGSDGHVLKSETLAPGTPSVAFANAPADSLVTVSVQSPAGSAGSRTDTYLSLTVPSSTAADHNFYVLPTLGGSANMTVSGACPSNATSTTTIQVWYGNQGSSSTGCTGTAGNYTFSTTIYPGPESLAADGTLSLAMEAIDGTTVLATAGLPNQSFPNNTIAVTSGDWNTATPTSNALTLQFPALPANQSATGQLDVAAIVQGQPVQLEKTATGTAASGASSIALSAPFVPLTASNYDVTESFGNDFSNAGLNWTSSSIRQHVVASLPLNEVVDTQSDLWPLVTNFTWSTSGSVTVTYGANAGTKAATMRGALVVANDNVHHTTKVWDFEGAPKPATPGTLAFPELPTSLAAFVPTPVASANGSNQAEAYFTDAKLPAVGIGLPGLPFGFNVLGIGFGTGAYHAVTAMTNAPLNPASVGVVRRIGLR